MADLDRRTVKPAHPEATIPDPDHRLKLPTDGLEVVWSAYWARLLRRGDVVVVEPDAAPSDPIPSAATLQGSDVPPRPVTEADPLKPETIAPEAPASEAAASPAAGPVATPALEVTPAKA